VKQTITTSERGYTVTIYKPGQGGKAHYGVNVSVTGESKTKVVREAKMMFEEVQSYALEAHQRFHPEGGESGEKSVKDEE